MRLRDRNAKGPEAMPKTLSKAQENIMGLFASPPRRGLVWTGPTIYGTSERSLLAMERAGIVRLVKRRPKWVLPSSWQASQEAGEKLWILLPAWRERAKEIRDERQSARRAWR